MKSQLLSVIAICLVVLTGCIHTQPKEPPRQSLAWILKTADSDRPDPLLDITHMLGGAGEDPPLLLLPRVDLQDATLTDLRAAASDGTLWFDVEINPCFPIKKAKNLIKSETWINKRPFYRMDTQRTRYLMDVDAKDCVTKLIIFNKEKMSLEYKRSILEPNKKSR